MKGHVYQRGKIYTYVIDLSPNQLTGERNQKSKRGFKTEKEAWTACHIKIADIEKGLHVDDTKMTVGEYGST